MSPLSRSTIKLHKFNTILIRHTLKSGYKTKKNIATAKITGFGPLKGRLTSEDVQI